MARALAVAVAAVSIGCGSGSKFAGDGEGDTDGTTDPLADTAGDTATDPVEDTVTDTSPETTPDGVEDTAGDTVEDAPDDTPIDTLEDTSVDTPVDTPVDTAVDTTVDTAVDTAVDTPADVVTDDAPPGTGEMCSSPIDLTGLTAWSGSFASFDNLWDGGSSCRTANGPEAWFVVRVPAGQMLRVTEVSATDVVLQGTSACPGISCLWSEDLDETFTLVNPDPTSPMAVLFAVEGYYSGETGPIQLVIETSVPPTGFECAHAIDASATGLYTRDFADYGDLWHGGTGCGSASGPEIWFTASVPAGNIYDFEETGAEDVVIQIVNSCPGAACSDWWDYQEYFSFRDMTGSGAATIRIAVERYTMGAGTVFVSVRNQPPWPGSLCSQAIDVTSLSTWSGTFGDYPDLWEDVSGCGYGNGREIWFRSSVGVGTTFTITETSGTDVVLERLASCGAASCAEYQDTTESISFTNTGLATATAYVVVESYSESGGGVSLTFTH